MINNNFTSLVLIMTILFINSSCKRLPPNIQSVQNTGITTEVFVDGIDIPWGIDFLPSGEMLVTNRDGNLYRVTNGKKTEIMGLPDVYTRGQGGLLDIKVHPKYTKNKWIYISYSTKASNEGGNTALMRFQLDGNQMTNKEVLFKALPDTRSGVHFGSRIVFDKNDYLFLSVGERGNWDNAQMLSNHSGKIHRLKDDGSIPEDNPFFNEAGAIKSIYSYGHRNPQGMVIHPFTGKIWEHEHGPKGGDEVNIVEKGKNYGWPKITYGINYNGMTISKDTAMAGMEQPLIYWKPSIAPSGMAFISTNKYGEDIKGNLLVGSLKFNYLHHCIVKNGQITKEERLIENIGRVRCVKEGPDGFIYVGVEGGKVLKLLPSF
ncbi:MAG: PQQ-dependent sugar dehydrogenase [Saprospiraceae bacterium]